MERNTNSIFLCSTSRSERSYFWNRMNYYVSCSVYYVSCSVLWWVSMLKAELRKRRNRLLPVGSGSPANN